MSTRLDIVCVVEQGCPTTERNEDVMGLCRRHLFIALNFYLKRQSFPINFIVNSIVKKVQIVTLQLLEKQIPKCQLSTVP